MFRLMNTYFICGVYLILTYFVLQIILAIVGCFYLAFVFLCHSTIYYFNYPSDLEIIVNLDAAVRKI